MTGCHSKTVVGWSTSDSLRADLVCAAVDAAADHVDLRPGCVFHSDRGTQHTSYRLRACSAEYGVRGSVGRTGVCWDNATAESFSAALKNEWLNRMVSATKDQA
ncbi:MAG: DDE-type integrase/transposase/recombinase, partial [Egibacteraceae bacterium]